MGLGLGLGDYDAVNRKQQADSAALRNQTRSGASLVVTSKKVILVTFCTVLVQFIIFLHTSTSNITNNTTTISQHNNSFLDLETFNYVFSNSVFLTLFLTFPLIFWMNVRCVFTSALPPPHPVIRNYMTGSKQSCILPHYNLGLGSTNWDQIVCFNLLIYFLIFLLHEVGSGCLKKDCLL